MRAKGQKKNMKGIIFSNGNASGFCGLGLFSYLCSRHGDTQKDRVSLTVTFLPVIHGL